MLNNQFLPGFVTFCFDLNTCRFHFSTTEHITIPITLPRNPLFAQPLFLRVVDTRLGGYNKPVVANGIVKLDTKIPSTEENPNPNYVPPASQVYISPEEKAVNAKGGIDVETDSLVHEKDDDGTEVDDIRSSLIQNAAEVDRKKGLDKTARNIQEQLDKRSQLAKGDKNVATINPVDTKAFITERQAKEDTGNT